MPTPTKGPRLGGGPAHERLMLANLASALFEHDRITTTEAKAKRLRPLAERLITFAKRGDLHARRRVMSVIGDKDVVHKLFATIGPNFAERAGGYTRIVKVDPRKGDNAPMAVIELVEAMTAGAAVVKEAERSRGTRTAAKKAPTGRTREIAEDAKASSATAAGVAAARGCGRGNRRRRHSGCAERDSRGREHTEAVAEQASLQAGEEEGGLAALGLADDAGDEAEAEAEDSGDDSGDGDETRRQLARWSGSASTFDTRARTSPAGPDSPGVARFRVRSRARWHSVAGARDTSRRGGANRCGVHAQGQVAHLDVPAARGPVLAIGCPGSACGRAAGRCPGGPHSRDAGGFRRPVRRIVAPLRVSHQ